MSLEINQYWTCYGCEQAGGKDHNSPVARTGLVGWPRSLRYLCPECLFDAIRDGKFEVTTYSPEHKFTGFNETREDGLWTCYYCKEVRARIGYLQNALLPEKLWFLCVLCLFDRVVDGTFTLRPLGVAIAAESDGPTVTINKETGAVSVDGVTFRW